MQHGGVHLFFQLKLFSTTELISLKYLGSTTMIEKWRNPLNIFRRTIRIEQFHLEATIKYYQSLKCTFYKTPIPNICVCIMSQAAAVLLSVSVLCPKLLLYYCLCLNYVSSCCCIATCVCIMSQAAAVLLPFSYFSLIVCLTLNDTASRINGS